MPITIYRVSGSGFATTLTLTRETFAIFCPFTSGGAASSTREPGLYLDVPDYQALFIVDVPPAAVIDAVLPDDKFYLVDSNQTALIRATAPALKAEFEAEAYPVVPVAYIDATAPSDEALFIEEGGEIPNTEAASEGYTWSVAEGWVIGPGDSIVVDALGTSDNAEEQLVKRVLELLLVMDTPKPVPHTWDDFVSTVMATDNVAALFNEAIAVSLETQDTPVVYRFVRVIEALQALEESVGYYKAAAIAIVTLAAADEAGIGTAEELLSELETNVDLASNIRTLVQDMGQVTDVAHGAMRIFVNEDAALVVGEEVSPVAALRVAIEEGLHPVVSYSFDGSTYVGYVVNTEGANPIAKYTAFPFNSFTQFAGRNIVAGEGGLYELGAESDDGQPIAASFKTMMIDFGSSVMKRVQTAYIGYTATGRLILRVHAVTGGKLREHWFEATPRTADAPRQHVRQLGRGLASRYWQFELVNVNGADFDVDKIEFHVVALSRRA